jgi:hypothetical protein
MVPEALGTAGAGDGGALLRRVMTALVMSQLGS